MSFTLSRFYLPTIRHPTNWPLRQFCVCFSQFFKLEWIITDRYYTPNTANQWDLGASHLKIKQGGRLPPAYFPPSILWKMLLKTMKTFFFQKVLIKNFWFFANKKFTLKLETTFLKNNIIWYAYYSIISPFTNLKKSKFFFAKPRTFWEIIVNHSQFQLYGKIGIT